MTPDQFVEFCADLLKAPPGFKNVTLGGSGADLGCDIYAEEDWVTHSGYSETIRWLIQCKHNAGSGRGVSSTEVGDVIGFLDEHKADGIFFITSTNVSGIAAKKLHEINRSVRHPFKARYWNRYELESRLLSTASHLVRKYFSSIVTTPTIPIDLEFLQGIRILAMPDMSIMAYQIIRRLIELGLEVEVFNDLTSDIAKAVGFSNLQESKFDAILFFRSEFFNYPISKSAQFLIESHFSNGGGCIFTPWSAWTVNEGINSWMKPYIPVEVTKLEGYHFEHHEEDVFVRWIPILDHSIVDGVASFDMRTTREFLTPKGHSEVIVLDSDNNPAVVVENKNNFKTAYINCCSHNCLRMNLMPSPFEQNLELEKLFLNTLAWIYKK